MRTIIVLRLSQLLLIIPCLLREAINTITDIEQFGRAVKLTQKIYAFPTPQHADILFNRAIASPLLTKINVILLISCHALVAIVLLYGLLTLLANINNTNFVQYNQKKLICIIGLCLGIFQYGLAYGFFAMDYFLSWMQNINFNSDIIAYSLPLIAALLFLSLKDFRELNS